MTSNEMSVFMKKQYDCKINKNSLVKMIPTNSYKIQQFDKQDKVEIRWRFIGIPINNEIKKMVEISRKTPNKEREYLDKDMNWSHSEVDPIFDRYVIEEYYYYSDK